MKKTYTRKDSKSIISSLMTMIYRIQSEIAVVLAVSNDDII